MTDHQADGSSVGEADWLLPTYDGMRHYDCDAFEPGLDPRCRLLLDWWRSFAPAVPARADFDIIRFSTIVGVTFLSERVARGRFRTRVQGEEIRYLLGVSRWPSEFAATDPGAIGQVAENYDRCIEREKPFVFEGQITAFDKAHARIQGVAMPLAADAERNAYILGCMARVK